MCKDVAKPFLKWAGGKGQLINTFDLMFPEELKSGNVDTYIEPFVGGGTIIYNIERTYKNDKIVIMAEWN